MQPNKIEKIDLKAQVKKELYSFIKQMDLNVSNKLPREEKLASMLGVSRVTLRSVLDEMSSKSIIFRRQGKGTFVNSAFFGIKVSFNPVIHFFEMIENSGYTPRVQIIYSGYDYPNKEVANALDINQKSKVFICTKFFYADDKFCAMTKDFIPATILSEFDADKLEKYSKSLFHFLNQTIGIKIVWDKVEIDVINNSDIDELKKDLKQGNLDEKPLLLLKGVNFDQKDRKTMYALEYIDTSILTFNEIRKRSITYENLLN